MLLAMIARTDALFSRGSLRDALEATLPRVEEEVNAAPEDHLLHVDVEEWVKAIVALRGMRTPSLGEPWMDEADEVQVDVSREQATRALGPEVQTVPGYRVRVHIPFDGDGAVFLLRTNTYTYNPPVAEVGDRELIHVIEYAHDRRVSIKDSTGHDSVAAHRSDRKYWRHAGSARRFQLVPGGETRQPQTRQSATIAYVAAEIEKKIAADRG